jgi:hypothetical protein
MVVVVGLVVLVLPGPGLLLISAGLALLATEFAWAQRWLTRLRGHAKRAVHRVRPAKLSAWMAAPPSGFVRAEEEVRHPGRRHGPASFLDWVHG